MSADNYVQVAKFDDGWRWAMGFMSDDMSPDGEMLPVSLFKHGPFETSLEACDDAEAECVIIEYGIQTFWKSDCGKYKNSS